MQKVVILSNPNSTGGSQANAKALAKTLRAANIEVTITKTKHAGHGEEIASEMARRDDKVILISASGDGGYHELINGALSRPAKHLVVGVLASGNANDHASAIGSDSLAQSIITKNIRMIDVIKVSATIDGAAWTRYAHSYIGMGVTAVAAKSLTDERPNIFTEKLIVLRSLFSLKSIKLTHKGKTHRYSSVLFGNIDRMSKVVKLSDDASVTDGVFEMNAIRFRSKLRLLGYILTAAAFGLPRKKLRRFTCVTKKALPIQMDGEVYVIDAGSKITVTSARQVLRCVL